MVVKFVFITQGSWCWFSNQKLCPAQIAIVVDLQYINILYIVTEGSIIYHLPQEKIIDALIGYYWLILYFQCFL